MLRYGKLARQAVAVLGYIAERYSVEAAAISSVEISQARNIPTALAAKLLSQASAAGLVLGRTGPGGGYRLAKPPGQIRLVDIVSLFGHSQAENQCPYCVDWCSHGTPYPLHDGFMKLLKNGRDFLQETTLAVFAKPLDSPPRQKTGGQDAT